MKKYYRSTDLSDFINYKKKLIQLLTSNNSKHECSELIKYLKNYKAERVANKLSNGKSHPEFEDKIFFLDYTIKVLNKLYNQYCR